jgi:hypothetical protein
MLINDGRILANGTGGTLNIFKSQVIDSYVQFNSSNYSTINFILSGASVNNPLYIHYKTPMGTIKNTYASDGYNSAYFAATSEDSYKPFYFSGNLNALSSINFNNPSYSYNFYYKGDLIKLLEQFPNLSSFTMNYYYNFYWNYSIFNQDITNITLPNKIKFFDIADSTLNGNVNTFKNFEKIEELHLIGCLFTGNFTNVLFPKLTKLALFQLYYLNGSFADLLNNNPSLDFLYFDKCNLFSGNTSFTNVSGLKYIYIDISQASQIIGNVDNWTFNTGLTSFGLFNQYLNTNITNWDFGNTLCTNIQISNGYYLNPFGKIMGSLSGWTMPNTLTSINLSHLSGITSTPQNFGNCPNFGSLYILDCRDAANDINDFVFTDSVSFIYFHNYNSRGNIKGNIETFVMPTGLTTIGINYNKLTGNISGLMFNSTLYSLYLNYNLLYGEIIGMTFPATLNNFQVGGNSGITINFNLGTLSSNISSFYFNDISGITGSFANLIFNAPSISEFNISNTPVYSDLSTLDPTKIYNLYASYCGTGLTGNLTNWLTGSTNLVMLHIDGNSKLSGDTSAWNVNNIRDLNISNTNLDGALKHNNVYQLNAYGTNITSNIATDFNFINQGYSVDLQYCIGLTGNLSGVTLNSHQYLFYLYGSTGITGSNAFIDYIFVNKKNWNSYNNYLGIGINNIGDSVTGATETSGSTGTWSGNIMDLSETQVNNLAAGLDYTGSGSNTPWDSKQKIWWMKYALISSTNPSLRYITIQISY